MRKLRFTAVRTVVLIYAAAAAGRAGVIDFEDLSIPLGQYTGANPVTSRGFNLTTDDGGFEWDADGAYRGSLSFYTDSSPVILTRVGGGVFRLNSFWAAEDNLNASRIITLTGFLSGGGTVTAQFSLDGFFDGPGSANDYQLFMLPSTFSGLTSVTFVDPLADLSIDDITVDVPEPSTVVLTLSAMVAFGVARSRRWRYNPIHATARVHKQADRRSRRHAAPSNGEAGQIYQHAK